MKTLLLIALSVGFALWLIAPSPNDFTVPYTGAQQARAGVYVYGAEATEATQTAYYGAVIGNTGDQQRFAYPAYSLFVFAPFTMLSFREAFAAWEALQVMLVLLAMRRLGIRPMYAALVLVALKEPLVNVLVGNTALWGAAWVGFGLAALERQQERRAGVWFALAALQPTITVPLALLVLSSRRKALICYLLTLAVIGSASLVLWGCWIPDWLEQIRAYGGYVNFMVWLPAFFLPAVILGVAALWRGLQSGGTGRYALLLSGLVSLLPLTGLYHLSLFSLARLSARWWGLIGVVMWSLSALPFAVRRFEPLILAGAVMAAHMAIEATTVRKPLPVN